MATATAMNSKQDKKLSTVDVHRIHRIVSELFLNSKITIISPNERSAQAQVRSFENAILNIQHDLKATDAFILMAEHNAHDFFVKCKVTEHLPDGSLMQPVQALIKQRQRKEERHQLESSNPNALLLERPMLYSDFLKSFSVLQPERDKQIRVSETAMREILPAGVQVHFELRKSAHMNLRMRSLDNKRKSIFVPDKNNPASWHGGEEDFSFINYDDYEKLLRSEEWNSMHVSEICEPLRYLDEITFGYIQVASPEKLNIGHYKVVNHIARQLEKFIYKSNIAPILTASSEVLDVSRSGMAFVLPMQKEIFQKYQNGEILIFQLRFPDKQSRIFSAKIRSGLQKGSNLRFGVEFVNNSLRQQAALDEYIFEYVNNT